MPAPEWTRIREEYESRLAERGRWLAIRERQDLRLSRTRLAIVVAALAMAIGWRAAPGLWYLVPLGAFVAVAVRHAVVIDKRRRAARAVRFYEEGLARLDDAWMGHGDAGERYRRPEHPYADDLDVFGRGSAFELLGTASTRAGQDVIARWLLEPAAPAVVRERQQAVRDLQPRLDLREALALHDDTLGAGDAQRLRGWATAPPVLAGVAPRLAFAALALGVAALCAIWWARGTLAGVTGPLAGLLAAEMTIGAWYRRRVKTVVTAVEAPAADLTLLVGVVKTIAGERVSADALARIQRTLGEHGGAAAEIARLDWLVGVLQSQRNPLLAILAPAFAATTQTAFAIEAWRARAGPAVPAWLDAIGEFEAVAAIAGHAAEHPDRTFPQLVDGPPAIEAEALAHPLLPRGAVTNDVALGGGAPRLLVVSGSNMSGKSTLLRAVGLNVVFAQAGAPVRAAAFRAAPLAVGAAIRIQDSLMDGRSRFLAEVLRLKQIVDLSRARQGALLFLLDEILGGTNSEDRRVGAESVLTELLGLGAVGLITTHDLSLGAVADRLAPAAANVHFADVFDGGGLSFDFRLRPGVVRTSNALALMRSVGLQVNTGTEELGN